MGAEESLREGKLDQCLTELQAEVRNDPSNSALRVFLFQLLAVLGQWDRSLRQLDVAGEMDAGTLAMVQTYRPLIQAEILRKNVMEGKRTPIVLGEPEEWIALLIEALRVTAEGHPEKASELRGRALEKAVAVPGDIDGTPFEWIADADSRLGPVLETVVGGHYTWVPFSCISKIVIEPPEDLRDMVWSPAHFTWSNGGEAVGMIPTRYSGTEDSADPGLRLARRTEWEEIGAESWRGLGQRMLTTDGGEYALLDAREISLSQPGSEE